MIELIVDNKHLEYSEISLNFILRSPLFNDSDKDGSAVFNFALPTTSRNKSIFQYCHRLNKSINLKFETAIQLKYFGIEFFNGILAVSESNPEIYECTVGLGKGEFNYLSKLKYLKDCDYGDDQVFHVSNGHSDSIYRINSESYPTANFSLFTVFNTELLKDTYLSDFVATDYPLWRYVNYYRPVPGDPPIMDKWIAPFPYVCYVLDRIFYTFGFNIKESFIHNDEELKTLCMITMNCLPVVNMYSFWDYFNVKLKDHVADVTISDFFNALKKMLCCSFFFDYKLRTISIKKNKDILSDASFISLKYLPVTYKIELQNSKKIILKFSGSDSEEFYKRIVKPEGIPDNYNLIDPVSDFADLPSANLYPNTICFVTNSNMYFIVSYDANDPTSFVWNNYTYNLFPKEIGDNDAEVTETIEIPCGIPLCDNVYSAIDDWTWNLPVIEQTGNSQRKPLNYDCDYKEQDLLFAFFRGLSSDYFVVTTPQIKYPLGSAFEYSNYGDDLINVNYSLGLDGEKGIYEMFWREWINFMLTAKFVKITILLDANELCKIDFSKKYRIGDNNYLLKEVRFTITDKDNGPVMAEIDAYLV